MGAGLFSMWLFIYFEEHTRVCGWPDLLRSLFHFVVLLQIVVYAISGMANASHTCRFVVLSSPFQFAPFFFSFSQLFQNSLFVYLRLVYLRLWLARPANGV